MKFLTFVVAVMSVSSASAAPYLRCRTEKQEIDPADRAYYIAGDSNQRIDLKLVEKVTNGKTTLTSVRKQVLKYQFSQSSGGESPWSLVVKKATVTGSELRLEVAVMNGSKVFLAPTLNLEVSDPASESHVILLNKRLAIGGKQVLYEMSDTQIEKTFRKISELVHAEKLLLNDLAFLTIESCRILEK